MEKGRRSDFLIVNANAVDINERMDNPIINTFIQAGIFGKAIILFLLAMSVNIWTIIQNKYFFFKKMEHENRLFLGEYRKTGENIFHPLENEESFTTLPMFCLFSLSKFELTHIMEEERAIDAMDIESIASTLARTISENKLDFEKGLYTLATIATVSPLLGLLGTVWGVMNAFVGMGTLGNASIAAVAPGISESLATTAVGLLVAIPSSIAYNYVKKRIQNEITVLNNFSLEVLGNIERKFVTRTKSRTHS